MDIDSPATCLRPPSLDARRCYIVVGCPRGGTSAIAGTLRLLGVHMGDGLGRKHEDSRLKRDTSLQVKQQAILELANAAPIFGWKMPDTVYYLRDLVSQLPSPHLVAVFRNPLDIAKSSARHDGRPLSQHLLTVATDHTALVERTVRDLQLPTCLISYEKSLHQPLLLWDALVGFTGLTPTETRLAQFQSFFSPGYKSITG